MVNVLGRDPDLYLLLQVRVSARREGIGMTNEDPIEGRIMLIKLWCDRRVEGEEKYTYCQTSRSCLVFQRILFFPPSERQRSDPQKRQGIQGLSRLRRRPATIRFPKTGLERLVFGLILFLFCLSSYFVSD